MASTDWSLFFHSWWKRGEGGGRQKGGAFPKNCRPEHKTTQTQSERVYQLRKTESKRAAENLEPYAAGGRLLREEPRDAAVWQREASAGTLRGMSGRAWVPRDMPDLTLQLLAETGASWSLRQGQSTQGLCDGPESTGGLLLGENLDLLLHPRPP